MAVLAGVRQEIWSNTSQAWLCRFPDLRMSSQFSFLIQPKQKAMECVYAPGIRAACRRGCPSLLTCLLLQLRGVLSAFQMLPGHILAVYTKGGWQGWGYGSV